jgi:hypothetical protein
MHQSAREFVLRIDKNNPDSKLVISNKEEVHITITMTSVRYLLLCFVNPMPTMRDNLSKIKNWNSNDFQKYARYMNEWSWVYYALHNLKYHHGLCGQTESVSQLINELIKQLTESQGSEYLGHWMACYFARPNSAWDFVWSMVNFQPLRYIHSQKTPEDFKYKVLDTAAKLGLSQVFDSLIQPCMHVDTQARSGMTLISCVRKGLVNALSVLLDRNEDLNAKDIAGRTLLHHAVENEHKAIVGLLLKRGANKAVTDKRGITALQLALQKLWVLSFY